MDLWRILVIGILKQGLRCDFDRLREIMNRHADVQAFRGHDVRFDPCRYELRTIRDNVALLTPGLLGKAAGTLEALKRAACPELLWSGSSGSSPMCAASWTRSNAACSGERRFRTGSK